MVVVIAEGVVFPGLVPAGTVGEADPTSEFGVGVAG